MQFLSESTGYYEKLRTLVTVKSAGLDHDARIAALCLHHGVRELWTADRDFLSFPAMSKSVGHTLNRIAYVLSWVQGSAKDKVQKEGEGEGPNTRRRARLNLACRRRMRWWPFTNQATRSSRRCGGG